MGVKDLFKVLAPVIQQKNLCELAAGGGRCVAGVDVSGWIHRVVAGVDPCGVVIHKDYSRVVEALVQRPDLRPFCVWVAPPSLDALRARLRARGTESSEQIEGRIARATREIEFSLTARCFDKIILNDDAELAYSTLKSTLDERVSA